MASGSSSSGPRKVVKRAERPSTKDAAVRSWGSGIEGFLNILNNRGKTETVPGLPVRTQGFVAWTHDEASLRALQAACVDREQQKWNRCFTVRYRVKSGAVFGTVIAALITDLRRIRQGTATPDLHGQFAPETNNSRWKNLAEIEAGEEDGSIRNGAAGSLAKDDSQSLLLNLERALQRGQRFVVFIEIVESDGDDDTEWQSAFDWILDGLPERVGFVLSGVSPSFDFPEDDHYYALELPDDGTAEQGQTHVKFLESPLHSDKPAREDRLGVNDYAAAMARFILHPQTEPPVTIGIYGKWGQGKSSFMELLDIELIKRAPGNGGIIPQWEGRLHAIRSAIHARQFKAAFQFLSLPFLLSRSDQFNDALHEAGRVRSIDTPEDQRWKSWFERTRDRLWRRMIRAARPDIITIRFNAWQFKDATQTWAGLAAVITEKLQKSMPWHRRELTNVAYAWKRHRSEMLLDLLLFPGLFLLLWGVYALSGPGFITAIRDLFAADKTVGDSLWRVLVPAGSTFILFWVFWLRLTKIIRPVSERITGYMKRHDYRAEMGYQHKVLEDLKFVDRHLKKCWPKTRVAVYIDDLDRCPDDKIMEVMQAINLILADCSFFVFLGVATEIIHRAIRVNYRKHNDDKEPMPKNIAEDYLRKIVQLSFNLPQPTSDRRFALASVLFSESARRKLAEQNPDASKEKKPIDEKVEETPVGDGTLRYDIGSLVPLTSVEEVTDTAEELATFQRYQDYLADNAREIKRLVNAHRFVKILLGHSEAAWSEERQRKLVKWLIFCAGWPRLVDDVIAYAKTNEGSVDCVGELVEQLELSDTERTDLKKFIGTSDLFTSDDIRASLALAAQISQVIEEEPEPRKPGAFATPSTNGSPDEGFA